MKRREIKSLTFPLLTLLGTALAIVFGLVLPSSGVPNQTVRLAIISGLSLAAIGIIGAIVSFLFAEKELYK